MVYSRVPRLLSDAQYSCISPSYWSKKIIFEKMRCSPLLNIITKEKYESLTSVPPDVKNISLAETCNNSATFSLASSITSFAFFPS